MEILEPFKEHFFKNLSYWWWTCSCALQQANPRRPRRSYISPLITVIIIPVELGLLWRVILLQIAYAAWFQDLRTGSHHNRKRTSLKKEEIYYTSCIQWILFAFFFLFKMAIVYVLSLNKIRNIATRLFSNDRGNIWL